MAAYSTEQIAPRYHEAIVAWQKKNFPELEFLENNWGRKFGNQTPFQLVAKVGKLQTDTIQYGRFLGKPKFEKAGEMTGNMFYSARDIIRAQASTELGSIEQHRLTLETAPTDEMKLAVLRIMAEELRHAYQMFWVLDQDPTWKKPGHPDIASDTMEELLAMHLGTHVLDAFNIPFYNFLDNIVFATFIDLVGKYQLEMQKVFSYAPMARSMGPMLSEEGFHIGSGRSFLRELAVGAVNQTGRFSLDQIQKTINIWVPRGAEMFGNERGGETAVAFGFKDRNNGTAQSEYLAECREVVELTNIAIVQAMLSDTSAPDARVLIRTIQDTGEAQRGVRPEDLLFIPHGNFYRKRGLDEVVFQPFDVHGNLLSEDGKAISASKYVDYLKQNLPDYFVADVEFGKYEAGLRAHEASAGRPHAW